MVRQLEQGYWCPTSRATFKADVDNMMLSKAAIPTAME